MTKGLKIGLKIFMSILIIFIFLAVLLYFTLNFYISGKTVKVNPEYFENQTTVSLSDSQLRIASFLLTKDTNPEFKKYPLIRDAFSPKNQVARHAASFYPSRHNGMGEMDLRFQELATGRYIVRHVDYRICYNYLFSIYDFGHGINGLDKASEFYFQEDYQNLTDTEFLKLCIVSENPYYYDFENAADRVEKKCDEIMEKLKLTDEF